MKNQTLFFAVTGVALAEFMKRQIANTSKVFSFPPTDVITRDGGNFEIQMALAGYSLDLLEIEVKGNKLTVSAKAPKDQEAAETNFFARGIARREFSRTLEFPDVIEVKEGASFVDGLLVIKLSLLVPESQKVRKVPINS